MLVEYVKMAMGALRAHRFRSALTVTSITLGAFSIVLMSSLATSGLTTLAKDIESLGGARIILIAAKRPERAEGREDAPPQGFTKMDRDVLFATVPHTVERTVYATVGRVDATNAHQDVVQTDLVAADEGFFSALGLRRGSGRLFSAGDNKRRSRVCVVAHDLAKKLFKTGKVIGQWITIKGHRCEVIGTLAKVKHWGTNFGFEWLDFAVMPLQTVAQTEPEVRAQAMIQLKTDHVSSNDIVKRVANAILVDRHRGIDDFQIWDFNAFMKKFETIFAAMEAIVGLIAGIALLVGGVGVMNMMVVSVSERTREIGLKRALGASPRAIAAQFLLEAGMLSGFGGLLGTVAGVGLAVVVNIVLAQLTPIWTGAISPLAIIVALFASLTIGLGFGFFPARNAAQLDPALALRK